MREEVLVLEHLADAFRDAKRVFVFTGAGASKESGLPTFRDLDGEWSHHDPMTYATLEGFLKNPVAVWNMYHHRRRQIAASEPNPCHIALAEMEQYYPDFLLATQNVDDLHERAGSRKLVKIHGDAFRIRCLDCDSRFDSHEFHYPDEFAEDTLPRCPGCAGLCRPDIVWFGEFVPHEPLMRAVEASSHCDLMLIIGTSGEVSGGYGFTEYALTNNAVVVEINPARGNLTHYANFWLPEPAGIALPRIWREIKSIGL